MERDSGLGIGSGIAAVMLILISAGGIARNIRANAPRVCYDTVAVGDLEGYPDRVSVIANPTVRYAGEVMLSVSLGADGNVELSPMGSYNDRKWYNEDGSEAYDMEPCVRVDADSLRPGENANIVTVVPVEDVPAAVLAAHQQAPNR